MVPKSVWSKLSQYTACDVSDALLKLDVPGAGFLPDILPRSTGKSETIVGISSTVLFNSTISTSFPNGSSRTIHSNPDFPGKSSTGIPYPDIVGGQDAIVVISQPNTHSCAVMGGILAARLHFLKTVGVVVDGRIRDLTELQSFENLSVWSKGVSSIGAGGQAKVEKVDVAVMIGETEVCPGDVVVLDYANQSAVAVPRNKVESVLEMLPALVETDNRVMADVKAGLSVGEAFKRHRGK